MDRLLEGYRRFRGQTWPAQRQRYESLSVQGQKPHTLVIACSDSRADPATVFDTAPGEIFAVRNVAGLVPPYKPDGGYHGVSAALEFGVRVLQVPRLVVMGHAQCGGVQAMVEGAPDLAQDFVAPWMEMAKPSLADIPATTDPRERLDLAEAAVIGLSMRNLMTFPWIAEAVEAGDLALHGFRFDIHTGELMALRDGALAPVD